MNISNNNNNAPRHKTAKVKPTDPLSREERLREELRKNLRKRKTQKPQ